MTSLQPSSPWPIRRLITLSIAFTGCRNASAIGSQPIPLADRPPWQTVFSVSGFRIAMDTTHLQPGPDQGWFVWFITTHAEPQGPDSLRFDRGRIRLLVRCDPVAFKSLSQELALGNSRPAFHQEWQLRGPNAVPWRTPKTGATDDQFLRAACGLLSERHNVA